MLINAIVILLSMIQFLIIVRIFLSWMPTNQETIFVKYLNMVTEPLLAPIRNLLKKTPLGNTMLDFSPLVVILLINLIMRFLR